MIKELTMEKASLPVGWEMKTLGDLSDVITKGTTPTSVGHKFVSEGINFIKVESISLSGNFISKKFGQITEEGNNALKRSQLKKGDILFSIAGALGRTAIVNDEILPANTNQALAIIRLKEDSTFLNEYILSTLRSGYTIEQVENLKGGVAQQNLSLGQIKSFQIPLPPLSQQKQIVAILDKAFAAIDTAKANAKQNLQNAKELFESYLQNVFENNISGIQSNALIDICELIVDCEHKTAPKQDTGYPSIRTPNIGQGVLILDGVNRVSEKTYKEWTRRAVPQENDLILAREAPAGNIGVIPENVKVCLGQRTVLIRPKKDKFISKYLAFLILSKKVQKQLLSHSTGATVQHINMKDIRAFKIYNLPTLVEQQKVINDIDALSSERKKLETIYTQKIADLEELKKSVLQKAFSGQLLVVND